MRPRHKAAENLGARIVSGVPEWDASMRPRHKAAENFRPAYPLDGRRAGFNEAAA